MNMHKYIIAGAMVVWATSTIAADDAGIFTIMGSGTKSCGTIAKDHEEDRWSKVIDSAWVNGYITSYNNYEHTGEDVAKGIDAAAIDLWIYNYCKENPLDNLHDATRELVNEFVKRQR